MNELKVKVNDDFLDGSYTLYNYALITYNKFLLYVQMVGYQMIGPNYYNEVEFGHEYMINYTLEGEGLFTYDGKETIVKAGDLIFIKNYKKHSLKPIKGQKWTFCFLHIYENELVANIYQKIFLKEGSILHNYPVDLIKPEFLKIVDGLKNSSGERGFQISSAAYDLLMNICIFSEKNLSPKTSKRIDSVVDFINNNFNRNIKMKDILEHSFFSKNHLERLFKEEMNTTISDYIFEKRLSLAKELLLTTNLPISIIAEQVGLSEYRSLYHMFLKAMDMTPNEYRKKYKNSTNYEGY